MRATATLSDIAAAEDKAAQSRHIALAFGDESSDDASRPQTRLAADEAALAKLLKKKPSAAEERVAIAQARDAYRARVQARIATVDAARAKYQLRTAWRDGFLARVALDNLEVSLQDAHTSKAQERASQLDRSAPRCWIAYKARCWQLFWVSDDTTVKTFKPTADDVREQQPPNGASVHGRACGHRASSIGQRTWRGR